jgi:hypothetical protein
MAVMFESNRPFQVWRAVVGHSQLLLRSTKSDAENTRVDVLFKPVRAMKLRTLLDGCVFVRPTARSAVRSLVKPLTI